MKQVYQTPDFDVSAYELDDIITISIGTGPVEGGDSGWVEIWRSRSNRSDLLTIISRARFALLCFFCALFCILCTIPFLYTILISCAYSVFVLNLGAVCLFFFVCHMRSFPHTPARPFHYSFSTSVFVFLLFSLPCREQASPKQFGSFLPPLKREVGCRRQLGGISKEFTEFKKNVRDLLICFCLPWKGRWVAAGKPEGFCGVIWNLNRKQITF